MQKTEKNQNRTISVTRTRTEPELY